MKWLRSFWTAPNRTNFFLIFSTFFTDASIKSMESDTFLLNFREIYPRFFFFHGYRHFFNFFHII